MRLGPISCATLIVPDLKHALIGYVDQLRLLPAQAYTLPRQRALDMGEVALIDAPAARLSVATNESVALVLIEARAAAPGFADACRGWTGLNFAVADLGSACERLLASHWTPLESADAGERVFRGLAGELIALSSDHPVGGSAAVCRLRGVTLAVGDLAAVMGFYQGLGLLSSRRQPQSNAESTSGACAEGSGELRGEQYIRFQRQPMWPTSDARLRPGLRMISFARTDADGRRLQAADDPSARVLAGPEQEAIELL